MCLVSLASLWRGVWVWIPEPSVVPLLTTRFSTIKMTTRRWMSEEEMQRAEERESNPSYDLKVFQVKSFKTPLVRS